MYNEIGVIQYKEKNYPSAKIEFEKARDICKDTDCQTYETVLINLANCHRKMEEYSQAIDYYNQCLSINDKNPSTFSALGFAYHLQGNYRDALNCYNKSSFLKSEDAFVQELIVKAI